LFQGRFKSILVEDSDRLAWLCHYIYLNPVRAGVCELRALKSYLFSSYWHLRRPTTRRPFMEFEAFLECSGGLRDSVSGRAKYEEYLSWLEESDQAKKDAAFDRMSRGWAMGSKTFKRALLDDERVRLAELELGSKDYLELREEMWGAEMEKGLAAFSKTRSDIERDPKSCDWKVALATHLKRKLLCRNTWSSENLKMGSPASISRYCSELENGSRPGAKTLLNELLQ
jgi:putative transposase